jgi:cytidylate kinase
MSVITIRGQLGSGAPEVGRLIARKLHFDYIDRKIITEVASRANWTARGIMEKEMPPGTLAGRILESLARSYSIASPGNEGVYQPQWWKVPLDDSHYLEALQYVIRDLAGKGSIVIRGRGSQFIFKHFPGALHMLLVAPLEARIERVKAAFRMGEIGARNEIDKFDRSRHEFIRKYFQAELEDPINYDLVLNTGNISFTSAASVAVQAVPFKENTSITVEFGSYSNIIGSNTKK